MTDLRTNTAAPDWEHGLIAGSGRVGVVLYGEPDTLIASIAHERFFVPANPRPHAPDIASAVPAIRASILDGDAFAAEELLRTAASEAGYTGDLIWTDPLGICGSLRIESDGGITDSWRMVDPALGEVSVHWTDGSGHHHALRALCPRDSQSVWFALESQRPATVRIRLGLVAPSQESEKEPATFAPNYAGSLGARVQAGARAVLETIGPDGPCSRLDVTASAPWESTAEPDEAGCALQVGPDAPTLIRVEVRAGSTLWEPVEPQDDRRVTWETLRQAQRTSHGELVDRSVLDLGGAAADTTEATWQLARDGEDAARRAVVEIAYISGRANAIAATGDLPPTLQGVWQGTWAPAWSADYTMNGNVQNGGIAGLIPTGTPELARSLLELVLPYLEDFRANARNVFGADGMLLPARMSSHGRANHFNARFPHLFWTGCGGWVLRCAADIVLTTGDRSIVDDRLWELARGVLEFAEATVTIIDGRAHLIPGYSPENAPEGGSALVADPTIDLAILRDAARVTPVLGQARGDHSLDERWQRLVERLPDFRVADDGTLAEWGPGTPENTAHRHASHLYPLWYDVDPAFDESANPEHAPALRRAALASVRSKLAWRAQDPTAPPGRMEMAFGLVQVGLAAAALGDADAALTCVEWLAVDHWRPALTSTHDAGAIFNLDASGGLPALVAAMLLSSSPDSLTLLPAVPGSWSTGSITGLRARGGLIIDDLRWDSRGCVATVRRAPEADWLEPADGVEIRAGRPFRLLGESAGPRVAVGRRPVRLELTWTGAQESEDAGAGSPVA